ACQWGGTRKNDEGGEPSAIHRLRFIPAPRVIRHRPWVRKGSGPPSRTITVLLVTGPVTRNMELSVLKAYRAMPEVKSVVAVGRAASAGESFARATRLSPRPQALLQGIVLATGQLREKRYDEYPSK